MKSWPVWVHVTVDPPCCLFISTPSIRSFPAQKQFLECHILALAIALKLSSNQTNTCSLNSGSTMYSVTVNLESVCDGRILSAVASYQSELN